MDKTSFYKWTRSGWAMGLYLFRNLPGAWFMGVRVLDCNPESARVALPYGWRSRNPFRSIYFAAQCAAGELSTGLLAMAAVQERPDIALLITGIQAEFKKKAKETLLFECKDGEAAKVAVERAAIGNQAQTVTMTAIGRLPDGTEATRVEVVWSFRKRER